jgi:hypothetical protein
MMLKLENNETEKMKKYKFFRLEEDQKEEEKKIVYICFF